MTTRMYFQRIARGLFNILTPLILLVAGAQLAAAGCPPRTVPNVSGECVVTTDLHLENALVLTSNTKLNCAGHRLKPSLAGSGTTESDLVRSTPEVAIFLNRAENVEIKNCIIDGFDFGIFAINSNRVLIGGVPLVQPGKFKNTIRARFAAISLMSVDDSQVRSNNLRFMTKGGRGLYVGRDSDRNRLVDNRISATLISNSIGFRAPGKVPSNPVVNPLGTPPQDGSAVLITQVEGPEQTLLNAIITDTFPNHPLCGAEKCLFQIPVANSVEPDSRFSEDNIFERNTINIATTDPAVKPVDGVVVTIAARTRVRHNSITGARAGIRVGIQSGPTGFTKQFPDKCNAKPERSCLSDLDCRIDGIDSPPLVDTCALSAVPKVFWVSRSTTIENNRINQPTEVGIATAGDGTRIMANMIFGNVLNRTAEGIRLAGKFGLETTVVTRNIVTNVDMGLRLFKVVLGLVDVKYRASVSLNDFGGYNIAVGTVGSQPPNPDIDYDIVTRLSAGGKGNFWGTLCPVGLDPNKVRRSDGTVNPVVTDDHPFGVPVALLRPVPLPQPTPCR